MAEFLKGIARDLGTPIVTVVQFKSKNKNRE